MGKKSKKNDKVFSFLRKRKNFEIFSTCSDGGDIEADDGACGEQGTAGRPRGKSQKNDKVFSFLRKRKNFEIFSTCFDGGDIEAGDGACRERGTSSSAAQRASVPSGLMELERLQRKSACSTAWYAQPSASHCLRVLACDRSGAPGGFRRRPHSRAQPTAACSMTPPAAHAYAPACTTA